MLPNILFLSPWFREVIWGGQGLREHYNKALPPKKRIGESWEVSASSGMESIVSGGPFHGYTLRQLVETHGKELLGSLIYTRYKGKFPILIKLLDAQENLSVQVHPDDDYVQSYNLGNFGKMEAWYILHSKSGKIAYGLKPKIGKSEIQAAILKNCVEDALEFFHVEAGDVVYLPPGTLHALCKGVIAYEVQQSSNLTFRIYDYNRRDPNDNLRELHIKQALDVITFPDKPHKPVNWRTFAKKTETCVKLVQSKHFLLERHSPITSKTEHTFSSSFATITFLSGKAELKSDRESQNTSKGDTFLIPAGRTFTIVQRSSHLLEYLIATIP